MIRCLVVDDEFPAREELKYMISKDPQLKIIGEADSGSNAIERAKELKPDLIFMDINMPDINGLEAASILIDLGIESYIVFVTAYDKYALNAFDVKALDYLLKPLSEERFCKCIDKIQSIIKKNTNINKEQINGLIREIANNDRISRIVGHKDNKLIPIDIKDIIYVSIEDKTTVVYTIKGKYSINIGLGELHSRIDRDVFFRTHKSFIVNLNMIEAIEPWFNSTFNVKLKNITQTIPVSRTYVKDFKEVLNMDM